MAAVSAWATTAAAHEPSEAAKQRMLDGGYLDYAWIGAEHMLTGYDHLLFLVGVLFFLTRPIDIVKFVSAFTVGHTITLLGATLLSVKVNHYAIDAIIALTVIYKAFENLGGFQKTFRVRPPPLLLMVFVFGLIHGLGLSARLQEMSMASEPGLVGRILTFNVGVELGQIAALSLMALALAVWRGTPGWPQVARAANLALIAGGVWLFALQVYAFANQPPRADLALTGETPPVTLSISEA
ncbi:MAG: HupE/UreJ family protein [Phenylobacterium sp.]|nr:HupE/UreJ family protein [Phenylobacterium sp.]